MPAHVHNLHSAWLPCACMCPSWVCSRESVCLAGCWRLCRRRGACAGGAAQACRRAPRSCSGATPSCTRWRRRWRRQLPRKLPTALAPASPQHALAQVQDAADGLPAGCARLLGSGWACNRTLPLFKPGMAMHLHCPRCPSRRRFAGRPRRPCFADPAPDGLRRVQGGRPGRPAAEPL